MVGESLRKLLDSEGICEVHLAEKKGGDHFKVGPKNRYCANTLTCSLLDFLPLLSFFEYFIYISHRIFSIFGGGLKTLKK